MIILLFQMAYIIITSYHQLIGIEYLIPFRNCINSIGQVQLSNDIQLGLKKILTASLLSSPSHGIRCVRKTKEKYCSKFFSKPHHTI